MNIRYVLFFVFTAFLTLCGCHQKAKRAKVYRNNMLQTVQAVIDSSLDYGDALQSYDKARATFGQVQYSEFVSKSKEKVEAMKDFNGDTTLQFYSLELLAFYKTTLEKNFKPFLSSIREEAFSEQERHDADSLYSQFTLAENQYWQRFDWAEKKFYKDEEIGKVEEK